MWPIYLVHVQERTLAEGTLSELAGALHRWTRAWQDEASVEQRWATLEGLTGGRPLEPQTSLTLAVERQPLPDGNEAVLYAMWHVPPDGWPCQSEGAVVTVASLTRHAAELRRAVLTSRELPPEPIMTLNLGGLQGTDCSMS